MSEETDQTKKTSIYICGDCNGEFETLDAMESHWREIRNRRLDALPRASERGEKP